MRITFDPADFPGLILLVRWTALLGLAWVAHGLLRTKDARLRLILWRSVLVFGLALPLLQVFPVSVFTLPIYTDSVPVVNAMVPPPQTLTVTPGSDASFAAGSEHGASGSATAVQVSGGTTRRVEALSWGRVAVAIWAAGFLWSAGRLVRMQLQLSRLRRGSAPADAGIEGLIATIQEGLGVRSRPEVRVSLVAKTPFLCGVMKPMIILPHELVGNISVPELAALLRHEMAHLGRRDLVWCVAWRWLASVFWFHPLVWSIPAAHRLACEQEADRVASDQFADSGSYAQVLAQLSLRVISLPRTEVVLTLNGAAQIVRRIEHIHRAHPKVWRRSDSVAGFGLAVLLVLIAAGGDFAGGGVGADLPRARVFDTVVIRVTDGEGNPVEGAKLEPYGFRVKGSDSASHYNWRTFGERPTYRTDGEGKVEVEYPVEAFPEEKVLTGQVSVVVSHPDFATRTAEISVDGDVDRVELERGISLQVSGYYGSDRQPVLELVPNVSGQRSLEWEKAAGIHRTGQLPSGGCLIQLMGRLSSGDIVFSEAHGFLAEAGEHYEFALELERGIRLEGRIDDSVPRPVRNGRVVISVRPKEFPASLVPEDIGDLQRKYGAFHFWTSYRPIAADGTFSFESIPPGEVDVIVQGEGFVSKNGGVPMNRINSKLVPGLVIGVPQAFALRGPTTQIEVATEPSATLELIARTTAGEPVEGADVMLYPNVMRMQTGIFGNSRESSEEPFRKLVPLPEIPYAGVTDDRGLVVVRNLPTVARHLDIVHPHLEVPVQPSWGDRTIRFQLTPGEIRRLEVVLQPKGSEFLGGR